VIAMLLKSDSKPLKIAIRDENGKVTNDGNFVLASQLTEPEKEKVLGVFKYEAVAQNPENSKYASQAFVTVHSLDGGLGEKLVRDRYKKELVDGGLLSREDVEFNKDGKIKIGAKGTDIGAVVDFEGQRVFLSVAEIKLLQIIALVQNNVIGGVGFTPLVNKDSKPSYEKLLDRVFLGDRFKIGTGKRTYRQVLEELGVEVNQPFLQQDVPGIDVKTNLPATDPSGLWQPGGHGQLGFSFFYNPEAWKPRADGKLDVLDFTNGDNINASRLDPSMIGMMVRHKLPIAKLTTQATPIDKKGGKDGVEITNDGLMIPQQLELADALIHKSETIFYKAGQKDGAEIFGQASVGKQPFNTNTIFVIKDFLFPMLAEVKKILGNDRYYSEVIAPSPISKELKVKNDREYRPLDAAIGTVIHNMNAFLMRRLAIPEASRSEEDRAIAGILQKYGYTRVLYFFDVPRSFFTPQKNPLDAYLQAFGNYYRLDKTSWTLQETRDGLVPPEFEITATEKLKPEAERGYSFDSGKGYWSELQNVIGAFGEKSDWSSLRKLDISGNVHMRDAILIGQVEVVSHFEGIFNLNQAMGLPRDRDGSLRFENIRVTIQPSGKVEWVPIAQANQPKDAPSLVAPRSEVRAGQTVFVTRTTAPDSVTVAEVNYYDETAVEKITRWFREGILPLRIAMSVSSEKALVFFARLGIPSAQAAEAASVAQNIEQDL
ncbi:MAG: UTP--glucose-1-phosphate uridylyltransferase, partial [Candidatus Omnitrophica bacterium]|nr:UTP--glucose-1-phosphate uridylyltransferase [Candidatus Omnitrophota bacterium]